MGGESMGRACTFCRSGLLLAGVALALGAAGTATAQSASASSAKASPFYGDPAVPDISGVWLGSKTGIPGVPSAPNRGSADGSPETFWAPWPLPYRSTYQSVVDARNKAVGEGRALGDNGALCLPLGVPRLLVAKVYPDEIVQTPGQVTLFAFGAFPIIVWTDGRPHPAGLKPSFTGHSTGVWFGDTLHVETVGLNNRTTLDHNLSPHSDKLAVRWTVRRVAPDILHFHVTLDDPEAFSEPVATTNIWRRKDDPRWAVLDDSSCFENNRTNVDENGNTDGFARF